MIRIIRSSLIVLSAACLLAASPASRAESSTDQPFTLDSSTFFSQPSSFFLSSAGSHWLFNALYAPATTRIQRSSFVYDSAGDPVTEAGYVGTLTNAYNSDADSFSSPFFRSTGGTSALVPLSPNAVTTVRVWDGGTSGAGTSWTTSSGINWNPDGVPVSGDTLSFTGTPTVPTTMQIGANIGALSVTFANNFNGTNTTTIGSNVGSSPVFTLDSGWSLTNNATSGVVTFTPTVTGGTTPLTFKLNGPGTVTVASGGTIAWNTIIGDGTNPGAITKSGAGTLTLGAANTYSGGTTVNAGILRVTNTTGSATGSGAVNVSNSGTVLAGGTTNGTGGISGPVTVNSAAAISPGTTGSGAGTTAILNTGALTLNSGSLFNVDLNSAVVGTGYDQLAVTGTVTVGGSILNVTLGSGFTPSGQAFVIVSNDSVDPVVGSFSLSSVIPSGYTIDYFYDAGTNSLVGGNDIALVPVPEPSTWIGGALALGAIGFTQRRRFIKRSRVVA